ncbi:MAG: hypothetical protein J5569_02785 [Oscillospiraceae bacterium]|nr:hypothetical protein [Oscillospiraceae bacterium]
MKTKIIVVLLVITLSTALSSCASEQTANTHINGKSNSDVIATSVANTDGYPQLVCEIWKDTAVAPVGSGEKENSKTIEFNNKTYTGEYWRSTVPFLANYQVDKYRFEGGWFGIKHSDGNLSSMNFSDTRAGQKSVDDCKNEAIRIAAHYIDINQYELTAKTEDFLNTYVFQRYFEGIETIAKLTISISTNGKIVTFSQIMTEEVEDLLNSGDINEFKNTIEKLTSEDSKKLVYEKIESIYKGYDILDCSIIKPIMVILDGGDIGVVYITDVSVILQTVSHGDQELYKLGGGRECILLREAA